MKPLGKLIEAESNARIILSRPIKVEGDQQHEMATAYGVRELGTALVVTSGIARMIGK